MDSEKDTLPNMEQLFNLLNIIHEEVKLLRQETNDKFEEMNGKFNGLRHEMNDKFESNRLEIMSVRVQLDRLDAQSHEILGFSYNNRADVSILREEVAAWAKDVRRLQSIV